MRNGLEMTSSYRQMVNKIQYGYITVGTYNPCGFRTLDLFRSRVSRDSNDRNVLDNGPLPFELSDFPSTRHAVHDGHFKIHEDDRDIDALGLLAGPES